MCNQLEDWQFGILGQPHVNISKLKLALDDFAP